ncbi:haloperoxidase [Marinicauda salina]|uniref:Haloperoxidase n=1 Tax=Marinicauda salina TaxID=2135793 RepID=A0A2U2BXG3_9PROT|nr:vanadium-dependent haloperoxidase [Marinicauda salina]PWE18713.1 haloperoxidase [Marinicauda salina]
MIIESLMLLAASAETRTCATGPEDFTPSAAYHWLDVSLEAAASDVQVFGARPTVLSRQMAIVQTAAFDAWAAYDDVAVGTGYGDALRRPPEERTLENKRVAIAYASFIAALDQYPEQADFLRREFEAFGLDPELVTRDPSRPEGVGRLAAEAVLEARHHDGANQLGDERGSDGSPYSDYTMYRPVNGPYRIVDPDRWQPIPASDGEGGVAVQEWLTPHWYRVEPFGLESADQFRAPPPPLVGEDQLREEIEEVARMNAELTVEQKALVEFMRDGPQSTGQSGHWLQMSQVVSCRDQNDLDTDVKLYFAVANTAMDAFIASWDSKIYYDTSRPWTLVRYYFGDDTIEGWGGPGEGTVSLSGSDWMPYSPFEFPTPPFAGYPSGHSTVSAASAATLARFTGSDHFGYSVERMAGSLTEPGHETPVTLHFPTFSETAEAAGISRLYGGYHIAADNIEGLEMGRRVSAYVWPTIQSYFDGTAEVDGSQAPPAAAR